jgi:hypothetical protein
VGEGGRARLPALGVSVAFVAASAGPLLPGWGRQRLHLPQRSVHLRQRVHGERHLGAGDKGRGARASVCMCLCMCVCVCAGGMVGRCASGPPLRDPRWPTVPSPFALRPPPTPRQVAGGYNYTTGSLATKGKHSWASTPTSRVCVSAKVGVVASWPRDPPPRPRIPPHPTQCAADISHTRIMVV